VNKNNHKNSQLAEKRNEINTTLFTAVNNYKKSLFLGQLRDSEPRLPHRRAMPPSVCQARDRIGFFSRNATDPCRKCEQFSRAKGFVKQKIKNVRKK
jgi:hypothetical protein